MIRKNYDSFPTHLFSPTRHLDHRGVDFDRGRHDRCLWRDGHDSLRDQTGRNRLDRDAATAVARNAFAQFAISGFNAVDDNGLLNWTNDGNLRITRDAPQTMVTNGFNVYCIDPLGITENSAYGNPTKFPFNALPELPNNLTINSVNLWKPAVNLPMGVALARRMFRASDDLIFGQAVETLAGGRGWRVEWSFAAI